MSTSTTTSLMMEKSTNVDCVEDVDCDRSFDRQSSIVDYVTTSILHQYHRHYHQPHQTVLTNQFKHQRHRHQRHHQNSSIMYISSCFILILLLLNQIVDISARRSGRCPLFFSFPWFIFFIFKMICCILSLFRLLFSIILLFHYTNLHSHTPARASISLLHFHFLYSFTQTLVILFINGSSSSFFFFFLI